MPRADAVMLALLLYESLDEVEIKTLQKHKVSEGIIRA